MKQFSKLVEKFMSTNGAIIYKHVKKLLQMTLNFKKIFFPVSTDKEEKIKRKKCIAILIRSAH